MLYTVAEAREEVYKQVDAGMGPATEEVLERINQSVRRLMEIAPSEFIISKLRLRIQNNTVILPRSARKLLSVTADGAPVHVWSRAYEYVDGGPGDLLYNGPTGYKDLVDMGDGWATWYEIPKDFAPLPVIALSTESDDVGGEMTVYGTDTAGEELFSDGTPGVTLPIERWNRGSEGDLAYSNMTGSTVEFGSITRVVKPVTAGYITMLAYDTSNYGFWTLAKYHPKETIPAFRRYKLSGVNPDTTSYSSWKNNIKTWAEGTYFRINEYCKYGGNYYRCVTAGDAGATAPVHTSGSASDGTCDWVWISENILFSSYSYSCATCISGLVKMRFIPLVYDADVLPIQSLDAIKLMVIAIREEENGNFEVSRAFYSQSIGFLEVNDGDAGHHELLLNIQGDMSQGADYNIT